MHAPSTDICGTLRSTREWMLSCACHGFTQPCSFRAGEAFLEETPRQYTGDRHLCDDFYTKKRKGAIIQLCTFACLLFIHLIKL
ncbi:hypothetical protein SAMD00079811_47340 [Scytonema sp. HK-05]|nr:hypothetical protein SAMD00079811_47340 [Scytonema sp. HK-05]